MNNASEHVNTLYGSLLKNVETIVFGYSLIYFVYPLELIQVSPVRSLTTTGVVMKEQELTSFGLVFKPMLVKMMGDL